jgi:hypothetical protein
MATSREPDPCPARSIKVSQSPQASAERTKPKFKFAKPAKQCLHEGSVHLKEGGVVRVTALRNPTGSSKLKRKGDPDKEEKGRWACKIVHWSGDVTSRDAAILNPNFHRLYPGAVYDYTEIANGNYQTLPYARKALTVTVNGRGFKKTAVEVPHPSLASVNQAVAAIRNSQKVQGGAITFGRTLNVLSAEHLFLRTGGSGSFMGIGGSHEFRYGSTEKSHRYFLEIAQAYYTISVNDTVHEPDDFFVTKKQQPGNKDALDEKESDPNWVFVESVTYGRLLQVMLECDESLESTGFDVEAHVDWLVASGSGNMSRETRSLLERSTITVAAIGGKPDLAGRLVNSTFANLPERIDDFFGGKGDEVPIAYGLCTLDGALVGTRMTTEFTSRQCAPVAHKYKVTWTGVHCRNSDDADGAEDTRLFVRIRAWDGQGKDIMDEGKQNAALLKTRPPHAPAPWSFIVGNEEHDIPLNTGESRRVDRSMTFALPNGDQRAKFAIRADVLEFDDTSDNDDFTDDVRTLTVAEVGAGKDLMLLCTHEDSRIEFNFQIQPVYD